MSEAWHAYCDTLRAAGDHLLGSNADPRLTDEAGWSALKRAAQNGHRDIVRALRDSGAAIDHQTDDF